GQPAAPSAQQARRRSRAEDRTRIRQADGCTRGHRREIQGRSGIWRNAAVARPAVQPTIGPSAYPLTPAQAGIQYRGGSGSTLTVAIVDASAGVGGTTNNARYSSSAPVRPVSTTSRTSLALSVWRKLSAQVVWVCRPGRCVT